MILTNEEARLLSPVTREEWEEHLRSESRHSKHMVWIGAFFDLMVVILFVKDFIL